MRNLDLGSEKISKLLMGFSIPCIISMLVSSLYNIVDQIFIGWGVGYLGNAATNIVFPFTVIALGIALWIGDGASALFSLSLGRGDTKNSNKSIGNAIVILIIVAIILTSIGFIFQESILKIFGVTENCYLYAKDYLQIILIGIPFSIITSGLNGIIRADGSPKYAMMATLVGAILNIIFDPIAIFVFNMGVKGAALATIFGQIISFIITIIYFIKPKKFSINKESLKLNNNICNKELMLGISSFITQVSIVIVIAVCNNLVVIFGPNSEYGADIPLSAIGIVMKVFSIVISFVIGTSVGGQPIIGYNYGASKYDRVKDTFRLILKINVIVGLIALVIFQIFPQYIINIFGSENDLYNSYALLCFRIYLAGITLCCITKSCSIYLQAIGKSIKSTILSVGRDVVFFIPGLIILANIYGVVGMLWAALISDVLSFILAIILIRGESKVKTPVKEIYKKENAEIVKLPDNLVITIAREYGSGGRYVGELLARELNIPCYDKEVITRTSEESGLDSRFIESNDQIKKNYNIYYNNDDNIFVSEAKIIKNLASNSCVIIGRCANHILKSSKNVYNVFLYSDDESKVKRAVKYYGLEKENALKEINKINKRRAKHYEYYTNSKWHDFNNYDLAINVDKLGIMGTVLVIKNIIGK